MNEAEYKHLSESSLKSFDASIRFAELAVRSLLILTGGAAVALLAFATNSNVAGGMEKYARAVSSFGGAAALAVLTAGLSYLAQYFFTRDKDGWGITFQIIAIVAWIISLGLFVYGVTIAADAVRGVPLISPR